MGGPEAFAAKLDTIFEGGRYWHGNEPCHQISYLYDYVGQPWKTQQRVRQIMNDEYGLAADGLAGNDDAGQMSAWYVFSAMGFYPVCPGIPYYALGSPCFDQLAIHGSNGKDFTMKVQNASPENVYIQSVTLNGKLYDLNYLRHEDILLGGELEVVMGPEPNVQRGTSDTSLPPSMSR